MRNITIATYNDTYGPTPDTMTEVCTTHEQQAMDYWQPADGSCGVEQTPPGIRPYTIRSTKR